MSTEVTIWNEETSIAEIKEIFAPLLTTTEFKTFIQMGKSTGLNPFLKEIWAVKYKEGIAAQIFIARDGYRKSAQRHVQYDYHYVESVYSNDFFEANEGVYSHKFNLKDRGILIGAFCTVKRKDSSRPMSIFIELKEYQQKYENKKTLWDSKPSTMIKKVAESQGLRMGFQELFAGSYEESEIDEDELSSQNSSHSSRGISNKNGTAQLPSMPPPIEHEIIEQEKTSEMPFGESNEDKKFIFEEVKIVSKLYDIDPQKNDSLIKTICRTVLTKNPTKETINKEITQLFYDVKKNRPNEINV